MSPWSFASEISGSTSRPIGHAADDMTTEYSGWAIAAYEGDYASEDDAEYIPFEYNEDGDVSTSDYYEYSNEEWNDEFVDGRRNKEEQSQLQILADRYRIEYDNSADEEISPVDTVVAYDPRRHQDTIPRCRRSPFARADLSAYLYFFISLL